MSLYEKYRNMMIQNTVVQEPVTLPINNHPNYSTTVQKPQSKQYDLDTLYNRVMDQKPRLNTNHDLNTRFDHLQSELQCLRNKIQNEKTGQTGQIYHQQLRSLEIYKQQQQKVNDIENGLYKNLKYIHSQFDDLEKKINIKLDLQLETVKGTINSHNQEFELALDSVDSKVQKIVNQISEKRNGQLKGIHILKKRMLDQQNHFREQQNQEIQFKLEQVTDINSINRELNKVEINLDRNHQISSEILSQQIDRFTVERIKGFDLIIDNRQQIVDKIAREHYLIEDQFKMISDLNSRLKELNRRIQNEQTDQQKSEKRMKTKFKIVDKIFEKLRSYLSRFDHSGSLRKLSTIKGSQTTSVCKTRSKYQQYIIILVMINMKQIYVRLTVTCDNMISLSFKEHFFLIFVSIECLVDMASIMEYFL